MYRKISFAIIILTLKLLFLPSLRKIFFYEDTNEESKITKKIHFETSTNLFTIPFYIYENEILRNKTIYNFTEICLNYFELQMSKNITGLDHCKDVETFDHIYEKEIFFKENHQFDYYFINSALSHPLRTKNASDAKLFIVPTLLSEALFTKIYNKEVYENRFHQRLVNLNSALGSSEWFQNSNGKDHVSIITSFSAEDIFNCGTPKWKQAKHCEQKLTRNIASCNMIQWYEGGGLQKKYIYHELGSERFALPTMYVSKGCNVKQVNKTNDLTFVGALYRKNKRCGNCNFRLRFRRDGATWVKNSIWNYTVFGYGQKCPTLSQALIGMHFPGDSPSASRLGETILSVTVPVFTTKEQYESVPDWINWNKISYFADIKNMTLFDKNMNEILSNRTDILMKTSHLESSKKLFDWTTAMPFEMYMVSLPKFLHFSFLRCPLKQIP